MHSFRSYLALNKHYLISCNIIHIRRAKAGIKIYVQTLHFGIYGRVTWQIADNQLDLPRMGSTEVCHQNASLRLRSHKSLPLPRGLQQKQAYGNDSLEGSCTQNIPTVCFLPPSLPYFFPQRKHLLLCLWHLKSTLNIAGDCSCVGGFPECSVTFLKEFFRRNILRHWNIALSYQNCSVTTFTNTLERWATDGIQ